MTDTGTLEALVSSKYGEILAEIQGMTDQEPDMLPGWKWLHERHRKLYIRQAARMLDLCELTPGGRLLDIGCGNCYLMWLARHAGMEVAGIDRNAQWPVWQALARALDLYGTVYCMSIERAIRQRWGANGCYAVIFATWTTFGRSWADPEWAEFFTWLGACLTPEGRAIIRINGDQAGTSVTHNMARHCRLRAAYTYEYGQAERAEA